MPELIRTRTLRIGDVVRVHRPQGAYTDLPPSVREGMNVTVLAIDRGQVDAENPAGERVTLAFPQIEMPEETWYRGRWVSRLGDPLGEEAYQWATQHAGAAPPPKPPKIFTPAERARMVVAYFPAIPEKIRPPLEDAITRAIKRAMLQQLLELEREADREALRAEGRGKQARGQDRAAIYFHRLWEAKLREKRKRAQEEVQARGT